MRRSAFVCLMLAVAAALAAQAPAPKATPPRAMRLYVLDCGLLNISREGVERYHVTTAEVGETRMPVPCFLVAHPKGTLMWDVGVIPDDDVEKAAASGARYDVNPTAAAVVTRTLRSQLAAIGYRPADITYVAISHAHKDHTANLNQFAGATWLTPRAEREFMWKPNNERVEPRFYSALEKSKWIAARQGRIRRVRRRQGRHQGRAGSYAGPSGAGAEPRVDRQGDDRGRPVSLSGPSAISTGRRPTTSSTCSSRPRRARRIEEYLKATKAAIWIEHEWAANAKLKKSPRVL